MYLDAAAQCGMGLLLPSTTKIPLGVGVGGRGGDLHSSTPLGWWPTCQPYSTSVSGLTSALVPHDVLYCLRVHALELL